MAASLRLLHSSYRRPPNSLLPFHLPRPSRQHLPSPPRFSTVSLLSHNPHSFNSPSFNSFPIFSPSPFSISGTYFDRLLFGPGDSSFRWNFSPGPTSVDRINRINGENKDSEVAVVMLGWLGAKPKHLRRYGAILDNLKDREDLLERIKGCVVDSGGDPDIDPKVWAAGFSTVLLKKSSSTTYSSPKTGGGTQPRNGKKESVIDEKEPIFIETWLLAAFEMLFSYLLNLPSVNQRLRKIISILLKNQPPCPQLYLYSNGDKVIPFQRVESFMEEQRRNGKQMFSFNFGSSPHVDHYRTFSDLYAT